MSMQTDLQWYKREPAFEAAGLVAAQAVMPALLARLAEYSPEQLARLSAVACRDLLVILGPQEALPWVDGVRYCAPDPDAPNLWLATHVRPSISADLLQNTLRERAKCAPFLLWHAPHQILPLDQADQLSPAILQWLAQELA